MSEKRSLISRVKEGLERFWYFTVRNTRQHHLEMGGFIIDFRQYDMRIRSASGNFEMKIRASEHAFGYLVSSIAQEKEENVHGYAAFMYILATNICHDDKLRRDIQNALNRYEKRITIKGKLEENEGDEEVVLESLKREMELGEMSRAQRRRAEREYLKEMKEILKEDGQK